MVECKVCGAKNALMKAFGIAPGDYCGLECYDQERDRVIQAGKVTVTDKEACR